MKKSMSFMFNWMDVSIVCCRKKLFIIYIFRFYNLWYCNKDLRKKMWYWKLLNGLMYRLFDSLINGVMWCTQGFTFLYGVVLSTRIILIFCCILIWNGGGTANFLNFQLHQITLGTKCCCGSENISLSKLRVKSLSKGRYM